MEDFQTSGGVPGGYMVFQVSESFKWEEAFQVGGRVLSRSPRCL
jgi:hypothetical protein